MLKERIALYHVDAFTDKVFGGNPAAICVLEEMLPDEILNKIALENNLPATVFIQKVQDVYYIRWFTPLESNLCGHGTLAAAFVIFNKLETKKNNIIFYNPKSKIYIPVSRKEKLIGFEFPLKFATEVFLEKEIFEEAFGIIPIAFFAYQEERCLVVFENENQVKSLEPKIEILKKIPYWGIVATAKGDEVDFVSRTFYPNKPFHLSEDPVTGASHCLLTPYWSNQLKSKYLRAKQISTRGGFLKCELLDNAIMLWGSAVMYSEGFLL